MLTTDLVRERATRWLADAGTPDNVQILEFRHGFVVWPAGVADDVATPRAVVDRTTAELSAWGSLPAQEVARRYGELRERFPADVRGVLWAAGWRPGRDVSADIDRWLHRVRQTQPASMVGLECFPAARSVLAEFGGLRLTQFGATGLPAMGFDTYLQPVGEPLETGGVLELAQDVGAPMFPIGICADDDAIITIDAHNRVYLIHWGGDHVVADSVDEAIVTLVRGDRRYPLVDERGGR